MQKCLYWDDVAIPIDKRRVAYAMYLMMEHGLTFGLAKWMSFEFIKE